MKILLVASGSGGHIYPCLEMAKYFKIQGHVVKLAGNFGSLEEKIFKENGFDFVGVNINKKKISSQFKNIISINKIYENYRPEKVLLFGNYISVGFGIVAFFKSIPIYLHEQNVIFGSANKLLSLFAKKIYLSLPVANNKYAKKSLLVGNPKSDVNVSKITYSSQYNVVIAMGSLGSNSINKILKEFISVCSNKIDYHLVVGNKYYNEFIKSVESKRNIHIYPYLENLSAYIKSADIFVSRAGATTISEILVNGVTSILIPSPYVKNNHQYLNAKYLWDNDACILIEEKNLNADNLNKEINNLISEYSKQLRIKMNAKQLAIYNSKTKIYEDMIRK